MAVNNSVAENKEYRRFRRYEVNLPGSVMPLGMHKSPLRFAIQTRNVSSGGVFFIASDCWEVGAQIGGELKFPMPGSRKQGVALRWRGSVVRAVPEQKGRTGVAATIESYEFVRPHAATGILIQTAGGGEFFSPRDAGTSEHLGAPLT